MSPDLVRLGGLAATLDGMLVLGIATVVARVLPRWCGMALIIGLLAIFFGAESGGMVVFGLVWLALGYVLWSQRGVSAGQPSRAR